MSLENAILLLVFNDKTNRVKLLMFSFESSHGQLFIPNEVVIAQVSSIRVIMSFLIKLLTNLLIFLYPTILWINLAHRLYFCSIISFSGTNKYTYRYTYNTFNIPSHGVLHILYTDIDERLNPPGRV